MKIKKIFLKTILYFPFYFLLTSVYFILSNESLYSISIIIIPVVVSFITVLSNVFDYNYYNDIDPKDYLESKHQNQVIYNDVIWDRLSDLNYYIPFKSKLLENNPEKVRYKIYFNILLSQLNSDLSFTRKDDLVHIKIEKPIISFLPDKSRNYRILRIVMNRLK